jgi:hypothetical protein
MKYNDFSKIVDLLHEESKRVSLIYDEGLDLINFLDPYYQIVHILIQEIYGKEGLDNFQWFCYENKFGQGDLKATDVDGNKILYDVRSLWWYLESHKKSGERM